MLRKTKQQSVLFRCAKFRKLYTEIFHLPDDKLPVLVASVNGDCDAESKDDATVLVLEAYLLHNDGATKEEELVAEVSEPHL